MAAAPERLLGVVVIPPHTLGAGFFCLLVLLPVHALAAGTVRGTVVGAAQAPLADVQVSPDEFGASAQTDSKGRFKVTLDPKVEAKGSVRLTFSLADHQTQNHEVKLPPSEELQITLTPLYARTFQPTLPPALAERLRVYRKKEIQYVQAFLGSKDKKLLSVEGIAGVGSLDLVLVALQDPPKAVRRPILWWNCEETDSLASLAEELLRVFKDQNFDNLVERYSKTEDPQGRRKLDREVLALLLTHFKHTPYTIVLDSYDRWLSATGQGVQEHSLAEFLSQAMAHPQTGKLILLSESKPSGLNPVWTDVLQVSGLPSTEALDFLRYLGLTADSSLLGAAADRLQGHPFALQLVAGSLKGLDRAEQESRLRRFLQVGESLFGGSALAPLLSPGRGRLTPLEGHLLDLLTVVRQPLTAGQMQEIGVGREPFTSEEIRKGAERLARERYWLETFQDARTNEVRFRLAEVARPFLEDNLGTNRAWQTDLHRRALEWYQRRFPVSSMNSSVPPPTEEIAGYDELVHQAFSFGELTDGDERDQAILLGARVLEKSRNWHSLHDSSHLLLSQLRRAQRLLEKQPGPESHALFSSTLKSLGDFYILTASFAEARRSYETVLQRYRETDARLEMGGALKSLGDLHALMANPAKAEQRYKAALQLYQDIGEAQGEANTLIFLAGLYRRMQRMADAAELCEKALPLYEKIEDRVGESKALELLADLYLRTGRDAEAAKLFKKVVPLQQAIQSHPSMAGMLKSLTDLFERIMITGLYSDLQRSEKGDLVGTEVYLLYGGSGYFAMVQCGGGAPVVAPMEASGARVSFHLPAGQPACGGSFSGTVSNEGLLGSFAGESGDRRLARQAGYWARQ